MISPESYQPPNENITTHLGELAIDMLALGPKEEREEIFHPFRAIRRWQKKPQA